MNRELTRCISRQQANLEDIVHGYRDEEHLRSGQHIVLAASRTLNHAVSHAHEYH